MFPDAIKLIEGKQLHGICRDFDLICLSIGEMREAIIENKVQLLSAYEIDFCCSCRFIGVDNEILFASDDKFCPKPEVPYDENFLWGVWGNSLFDYKASIWLSSNSPIYVVSAKISEFGDMKILFSNGDLLEIFVSYSERESWRFFEQGADTDKIYMDDLTNRRQTHEAIIDISQ